MYWDPFSYLWAGVWESYQMFDAWASLVRTWNGDNESVFDCRFKWSNCIFSNIPSVICIQLSRCSKWEKKYSMLGKSVKYGIYDIPNIVSRKYSIPIHSLNFDSSKTNNPSGLTYPQVCTIRDIVISMSIFRKYGTRIIQNQVSKVKQKLVEPSVLL